MKRLIHACLLGVSFSVTAAGEDVPADRNIYDISVFSSFALIQVTPPIMDMQGCPKSGSGWLKVDLVADKSLFATLLTAATARQTVGFGLLGCNGEYPLVKRVDVSY